MTRRLLCSDLVQLTWKEADGSTRQEVAILENLSRIGVGLFMGVHVAAGTSVQIIVNGVQLAGYVCQCHFRDNGYMVGLELDSQSKWAQEPGKLIPEHLLDVSRLDFND